MVRKSKERELVMVDHMISTVREQRGVIAGALVTFSILFCPSIKEDLPISANLIYKVPPRCIHWFVSM